MKMVLIINVDDEFLLAADLECVDAEYFSGTKKRTFDDFDIPGFT